MGRAAAPMGRVRARRAVAAVLLSHVALVAVLRAAFGLALRTSDDAEMMAAVSGYDGGRPRPELLFTNVLVGHVLRALYAILPEAPWYGLYLHGLQAAAVAVIVVALLVLLEGAPRITAAATIGAIVLLVPGFVLAVQFTIVAFLVTTAGLLLFLALRRREHSAIMAAGLGGAVMVVGLLVRFQSFAATVAVSAAVLLLLAVARRRIDTRGVLALASVVGILGGASIAIELRHWETGDVGPRPLPYLTSQLSTATADTGGDPAAGLVTSGTFVLSANDRALMSSWLIYPEMLGPAATSPSEGGPADSVASTPAGTNLVRLAVRAARGLIDPLLADPDASILRSARSVAPAWWLIALAIPVILLASGRRATLAGVATLLFGLVLVGGISATRLPDRVLLPLLLVILFGTAIVSAAGRGEARPARVRAAAVLAAAMLSTGAFEQARTTGAWIEEQAWREDRATRFFDELEELAVGPSDTVVLWLVDTWWVMDPIGWDEPARYRDGTVQLAGWQYRLPYRAEQRRLYDIEDWIGAVADRDDVLLVADPDRVDLLATLLRERRGRLCTEPELLGAVRDGRDVLVRRFEDVTCYGVAIQP